MNRIESLRVASQAIQQRIQTACLHSERNSQEIQLIWVSKTHPVTDVECAILAGAQDFGENKVQEAVEKFTHPRPGVSLHIIGPIQSNKLRKAAQIAQWIHSVDRLEQVHKLSSLACEFNKELHLLFQVNTSGEDSKSGIPLNQARDFLKQIPDLPGLRYRGLMTIGPASGVPEDARLGFRQLQELQKELLTQQGHFRDFNQLSMGMSHDLEVAIDEGATMIRVGTALFGQRDYPSL